MKKIFALVSFVISTQSFAAINCKQFKDEVQSAKAVVDNFGFEVEKLQDKLLRIEDRITDKMALLDPITYEINEKSSLINNLSSDKGQLLNQLQELEGVLIQAQDQESFLLSEISELEIQIDNMSARSSARRTLMRQKNRKKKQLERVQADILVSQQQIGPVNASISAISNEIAQVSIQLSQLEQDQSLIENQKPRLSALVKKKNNNLQEIADQDIIAQENIDILNIALEKQLMCKTYTVKYDLSLDIAKEIYEVGCENYQLRNLNGKFKKQAQEEAFNSICN